ncbi:hypothetical protein BH11ACT4_BH11ACT4_05140 [soil metagenome]
MEVEELLARAWKAVLDAGIPEPLQEFAFKEALSRLSAGTPAPVQQPALKPDQTGGNGTPLKPATATIDSVSQDSDVLFAKFSHESGIPVTDLERVYYFVNGEPHLNGPRSKFGSNTTDQAKVVALAIIAAYDYALDRKTVSDAVVRAEIERLKCGLGGNYARRMDGIKEVSWVGAARQKEFKTKPDTPESLKKAVAVILGSPAE